MIRADECALGKTWPPMLLYYTLGTKLCGNARTWFTEYERTATNSQRDAYVLLDKLKERYGTRLTEPEAIFRIGMRPKKEEEEESFEEYANALRQESLGVQIKDSIRVEAFLNGLNDLTQALSRARNPKNLSEAVAAALGTRTGDRRAILTPRRAKAKSPVDTTVAKVLAALAKQTGADSSGESEGEEKPQWVPKPAYAKQSTNGSHKRCHADQGNQKGEQGKKPRTESTAMRSRFGNKCFNCDEERHFARKCPKPRKGGQPPTAEETTATPPAGN